MLLIFVWPPASVRGGLIIDATAFSWTFINPVSVYNVKGTYLILGHIGYAFNIAKSIEPTVCATLSFNNAGSRAILHYTVVKCSFISSPKILFRATEHPRQSTRLLWHKECWYSTSSSRSECRGGYFCASIFSGFCFHRWLCIHRPETSKGTFAVPVSYRFAGSNQDEDSSQVWETPHHFRGEVEKWSYGMVEETRLLDECVWNAKVRFPTISRYAYYNKQTKLYGLGLLL